MRSPWIAFIPALVCLLLLSACTGSRKEAARELPDPAGLIAEHRMKEIRRHQRLVVGIAPSPLADAERHLVSALLKDTGYRFRIITAEKETLFAFLRGARADIVCGLFTGQELKDAYLIPAAPYLPLSFHILHHKEFKEPGKENSEGELLYPDTGPEPLFVTTVQTKLRKRPLPREALFREMEKTPEKRAVFLCNFSVPKQKKNSLIIKNAECGGKNTQLCFGVRRQDAELAALLTGQIAKLSADGTLEKWQRPFLFQMETKPEPEVKHEKK